MSHGNSGGPLLNMRGEVIGLNTWCMTEGNGLYFASSWDKRYKALLAMHDENEPDRTGGLLVASYGKGTYIYTGLAFFRQLPAGVPGALRLFINLLAGGRRG